MTAREFMDFLHVLERMKCNVRHGWTSTGRRESVAEHSYRLCAMAFLLKDEFPGIDMDKVLRMCIVHDWGEAVTGDIPSFLKTDADEATETDAVGGLFDMDLGAATDYGTGSNYGDFALDDIADYTGQTAANTGAAADALSTSTEELEYLRDIAERDAINRFTTAEVRIDMTGMTNRIEGGADLDGVISTLTDGFTEALLTAAEGVHA